MESVFLRFSSYRKKQLMKEAKGESKKKIHQLGCDATMSFRNCVQTEKFVEINEKKWNVKWQREIEYHFGSPWTLAFMPLCRVSLSLRDDFVSYSNDVCSWQFIQSLHRFCR